MKARLRVLAAVGAVAIVAAGCGSSTKGQASVPSGSGSSGAGVSGSNKASATGVTPNSVTIGVIASLTGPAGPEYANVAKGVQARFAAQNAQGGVGGRKLEPLVKDDQTSPAGVTAASQLLAGQSFAVIGLSPVLFAGARTLQQEGVPVVGAGTDGPEWAQQPYTNMFDWVRAYASVTGGNPLPVQYTYGAQFVKDQGGTNVASFGYGISPSSSQAAKGFVKAADAVGIKVGLLDTSIPFGSVNAGPIALQMKQANVDAAWLSMDNNTNFAIATAARQTGVNLKVAVSATGYGQSLLDDPSAVAAAQAGYFLTLCAPVKTHSAATQTMQKTLATYESFTGVPGFDWCVGYVSADLTIKGLQLAGQNPTRASFINGLHGVTNYDAGGLLPNPANFSLSQFGKAAPTSCQYFVKLQGTAFVPTPPGGKPVCGTLIHS